MREGRREWGRESESKTEKEREGGSDWLTCSNGDIERSCSLLVHVPSTSLF